MNSQCNTYFINYSKECDITGNYFENIPLQTEDFNIIQVDNCPTTIEASKFLSNKIFQSFLTTFSNSIIVFLKINEKLDEKHAEVPKKYEFEGKHRILISYESKINESEKIIYWKNENYEDYLTLKLFDEFSNSTSFYVREFIVNSLNDVIHKLDPCDVNPTHLLDSRGYNLLMKSIEDENSEIFDELFILPFNINHESDDELTAADIAWKKKNFQILLKLLKANSTYPKKFNENQASELKEFHQISIEIHDAISNSNQPRVLEILDENKDLKYFYNSNNQSAATIAINSDNIEAYKLLIQRKLAIGPYENVNEIIADRDSEERYDLRNLHSQNSQFISERYLMIHFSNIVISHDDLNASERFNAIQAAFKLLNDIPETKLILQITATSKTFKTHFDFIRYSTQHMDPYGGAENVRGNAYNNGLTYLAAKLLLNVDRRIEAIGTLAHEFCHFATQLTFRNSKNPYALDDYENEEKFWKIIQKCQDNRDKEKIIDLVFYYDENLWPAELIVRVPQLIVVYHDNTEKLKELREIYDDLFDYYENYFMPQMNETLTILQKLSNDKIDIKFNELTDALKTKIFHSDFEFQGIDIKFSEICTDVNSKILKNLTSNEIRGMLVNNSCCVVGDAGDCTITYYAERDFIDYNFKTVNYIGSVDIPHTISDGKLINYNEIIGNICDINFDDEMEMENNKWIDEINKAKKNFDEISLEAEKTKLILLSDHAATGKTTTFTYFESKLKEKYRNYWVSYVDLKRHLDIYKKYSKTNKKALNVERILIEILDIDSKLSNSIFTHLFKANQVILLFDGVDEIAPKYKNFIIKLIESIRESTENQLWISSRPHHMNEFIEKFNKSAYKLLPFEYDDERKYFIQIVLKNYDIIDENEQNAIIDKILNSVNHNPLNTNNLLLLKLLVEISINDENVLNEFNQFSLYEAAIEMKRKLLIEKGEIVDDDRENTKSTLTIWQVHQIYSIKLLYGDYFEDVLTDEYLSCTKMNENYHKTLINFNELSLFKRWRKEKVNWTSDAISRYGFLIVDNWNAENEFPDFCHRTFAEFFAAKYFIENIFDITNDDDDVSSKELMLRLKFLLTNLSSDLPKFLSIYYYIKIFNSYRAYNDKITDALLNDTVKKFLENRCERFINGFYDKHIFTFFQSHKVFGDNFWIRDALWLYNSDENFIHRCFNKVKSVNKLWHVIDKNLNVFNQHQPNYHRVTITTFEEENLIDFLGDRYGLYGNKNFNCILMIIKEAKINHDAFRNFIVNCLNRIIEISFKDTFICYETFEFFDKLFVYEKRTLVKNIKNAIRNSKFYSNTRIERNIVYAPGVEYFWDKLERFLNSNESMMRSFLLNKYRNGNPLIYGYIFDNKSVVKLYEKYCKVDEIERIFKRHNFKFKCDKSELIKQFLSINCDEIEKFNLKKFLTKRNKEGYTILAYLKQVIKENQILKEDFTKIFNISMSFAKEFFTKNQIDELLLNNINKLNTIELNENEKIIKHELDEIYRNAPWNDIVQSLNTNDFDDITDTPYYKEKIKKFKENLK